MNLASRRNVATPDNLDAEDAATSQLRALKKRLSDQRTKQASRLVEMASTVESLRIVVGWSDEQLSKWLQKHAAMSAAEAATFLAFGAALGSRSDEIESLGLSYPTIEALVRHEESTRAEVLQRLALGEQIDAESIDHLGGDAAISKLTGEQAGHSRRREAIEKAGADAGSKLAASLEKTARELLETIDVSLREYEWYDLADDGDYDPDLIAVRAAGSPSQAVELISTKAVEVRSIFTSLFGAEHADLSSLLDVSVENDVEASIAFAWHALSRLASGNFDARHIEQANDRFESIRPGVEFLAGVRTVATPLETERLRPSAPKSRLTFIDFGAGIGSTALGLYGAGCDPVAIYENGSRSHETIETNREDWKPRKEERARSLSKEYGPYRRKIDLLTHGLLWKKADPALEEMQETFDRAIAITETVQPRAFYFGAEEAVSTAADDCCDDASRLFGDLGYDVSWHTLDPSHFGLAQSKRLHVLVGIRDAVGKLSMPAVPDVPRRFLPDVIGDLIQARAIYEDGDDAGSKRYRTWLDLCAGKQAPAFYTAERSKNSAKWAALGIHFSSKRQEEKKSGLFNLTIDMIKRIQGYPSNWILAGRPVDQEVNLTSSMPPVVAKMIGLAIHSALTGERFDYRAALGEPLPVKSIMPALRRTRFGNLSPERWPSSKGGIRTRVHRPDPSVDLRDAWQEEFGLMSWDGRPSND